MWMRLFFQSHSASVRGRARAPAHTRNACLYYAVIWPFMGALVMAVPAFAATYAGNHDNMTVSPALALQDSGMGHAGHDRTMKMAAVEHDAPPGEGHDGMAAAGEAHGARSLEALSHFRIGANISRHFLENGLELLVIPERRAPVVTHYIWYRVGAADEPAGQSGIAHLLEHMMFKGTTTYPGDEFSQTVARRGGRENAFTSQDYTAYFQRVQSRYLEQMMIFEADRMTGVVFDPQEFAREREVVLEERRMRVENNVQAQLAESAASVIFINHPYGNPVIGWRDEIEALTLDNVKDFYRRHYQPQNASVVVVGDVDPARVLEMAQRHYGRIPGTGKRTIRHRPDVQTLPVRREVSLRDPKVGQDVMSRTWLVPSAADPALYPSDLPGFPATKNDAAALAVLAEILGGGNDSRLYRELLIRQKKAVAAGAYYQPDALDTTRFVVYAVPGAQVTKDELGALIDQIAGELIDEGVSEAEITKARRKLMSEAVYGVDSQVRLAQLFGAGLTTGLKLEDIQNAPRAFFDVTREDVQAVAAAYLSAPPVTSMLLRQ